MTTTSHRETPDSVIPPGAPRLDVTYYEEPKDLLRLIDEVAALVERPTTLWITRHAFYDLMNATGTERSYRTNAPSDARGEDPMSFRKHMRVSTSRSQLIVKVWSDENNAKRFTIEGAAV